MFERYKAELSGHPVIVEIEDDGLSCIHSDKFRILIREDETISLSFYGRQPVGLVGDVWDFCRWLGGAK
jgi:hypothetical protein